MRYSEFVPDIAPEVLGCPDTVIERVVRDTAIEFFNRSATYVIDQDPVTVDAETQEIDLDVPVGTNVKAVTSVKYGGDPLPALRRADLDRVYFDWPTETGTPAGYVFTGGTAVRLVPYPTEALPSAITIRFLVVPSSASESIPDDLARRYWSVLTAGAKSRLLRMAGPAWANPGAAAAYQLEFERGVRDARVDAAYDWASPTVVVEMRNIA